MHRAWKQVADNYDATCAGAQAFRLVGSGCLGPIPPARRLNSLHFHTGAPCAETICFCRIPREEHPAVHPRGPRPRPGPLPRWGRPARTCLGLGGTRPGDELVDRPGPGRGLGQHPQGGGTAQ
jgi:hypothetical protein